MSNILKKKSLKLTIFHIFRHELNLRIVVVKLHHPYFIAFTADQHNKITNQYHDYFIKGLRELVLIKFVNVNQANR